MERPSKRTRLHYAPAKVIAEIGCNHQGSKETAKELLTLAKEAGATVGKLQKRHPKELLTEEIISLNPTLIKVGSPSNLHWEMQELLRDTYQGEVHISTGMTSREDVDKIIEFWERGKGDAKNRVVLYACTSAYPVQFKDVCLLEIARLKEQYEDRVKAIGFSGHHLGIAIDIAAYVLGATWIERHFTKDRTWKGTDHAASLEFPGLSKLIRDLRATTVSLSYKDGILDVEKEQEAKLKWGFYNARPKEAAKDATAKDAEAEC
ncbi:unnamed protein product [Durusdinium trenchii]|uniref:PseI/NeuA/B-like domain-containing protein n=1 Tax=Durusdinium trenchii TaxID=1381693 RepID=A0ABP0KIX6_9DINO